MQAGKQVPLGCGSQVPRLGTDPIPEGLEGHRGHLPDVRSDCVQLILCVFEEEQAPAAQGVMRMFRPKCVGKRSRHTVGSVTIQ